MQNNFSENKWGGRPFGTFPKIRPFWYPDPSLNSASNLWGGFELASPGSYQSSLLNSIKSASY